MTEQLRGATKEPGVSGATALNAHAEGTTTWATGAAAHAEGLNTTASGAEAHAEGLSTTASAAGAHAEGNGAIANATYAHSEGLNTGATATAAHAEGRDSYAQATYAHAEGYGTSASANAAHSEGSSTGASGGSSHAQGDSAVSSRFAQDSQGSGTPSGSPGSAQANAFTAWRSTTDATPTVLTFNGQSGITLSASSNINVLTIPVSRGHRFRIEAIARRTDVQTDFGAWTITGTIVRNNTGSARFISTPTVVADLDAAASAWTLAVSVDTSDATNNYLKITATGEAAKSIRWLAAIYTVELS